MNTKKHECKNKELDIIEEIKPKEALSLSDKKIKEKVKERNLDKHFSFHKENLKLNNFKISDNQRKCLLKKKHLFFIHIIII